MWKGFFDKFFTGSKKKQPQQEYFIATQGQSQNRVLRLGLANASEDASYILDKGRLCFRTDSHLSDPLDYKPDPSLHWIIDLKLLTGGTFNREILWKIFDTEWRSKYRGAGIYGKVHQEERWTYVIAGDSPENYSQ